MKRAFAHIGFSALLTTIALNVFGVMFAEHLCIVLAGVFVVALVIPKFRQAVSVPLCAGSALLVCFIFIFRFKGVMLEQSALDGKAVDAVFYLTSLGEQTRGGFMYTARVVTVKLNGAPRGINVRLYSNEQLTAAGYQLIEGKLRFANLGSSGYSSFGAWGKGIFMSAKPVYYDVTDSFVNSPMRKILELRYELLTSLGKSVRGDEGALAAGLLIGDKSMMSDELTTAFKLAGCSHLTAVSGLHLSAVTGVFVYVFRAIGLKKKIYSPILITVIVLYCALSGFSKSVVRAGIMMTVMLLGAFFERHADALNSLGIALFLICLNPFAVCDLSTLFTAMCVFAIVAVFPELSQKRRIERKQTGVKSGAKHEKLLGKLQGITVYVIDALLLSATITFCSLPIMSLFFGYVSVVGIILNILIIPFGSLAIVVSMLSSPFICSGVLAGFFAGVVRGVNGALIWIVKSAAALPFATANLPPIFVMIIAGALILLAASVMMSPALVKKTGVAAALVIVILLCAISVYDKSCSHIYVTENGAVAVCTPDGVTVAGVKSSTDCGKIKSYLTGRYDKIDRVYCADKEACAAASKELKCDKAYVSDEPLMLEADDVSVCMNGGGGDIDISDGALKDEHGIIKTDGDVLYTVRNGKYTAAHYSSSLLT